MTRIGFAYNCKDPAHDGTDRHAEFESPATIEAVSRALAAYGEVVHLPCDAALPAALLAARPDVVFTIAEGEGCGRDREAYVPALCGLLGIPCTGSDAAALGITMDKALTKRIAQDAGVRTAPFTLYTSVPEDPPPFGFPAFLKPAWDGTSRGIFRDAVVRDMDALRRRVSRLLAEYAQPVLAEPYLDGRDFCVGLLGNGPPRAQDTLQAKENTLRVKRNTLRVRVLQTCEVLLGHEDGIPFFSFEYKRRDRDRLDFSPDIPVETTREMETMARMVWNVIGLRDYARIDFRTDAAGVPHLLEVNALPGLSPVSGIFTRQAAEAGIGFGKMIGEILERAAGEAGPLSCPPHPAG